MNVKMAVKMAKKAGITVKTVVANDDVASAPKDQREKRRGVAGEVLMWKVGGAKAAKGGDLDEVIAAAQKAIDNTRSVGIGLTPCTLPAVGHPNFEIKEGTMEVGIGHHGEPGIEVCPLESANEMAKRMVDVVVPDYPFVEGDEVVVLVSGLGATPVMELYVLYDEIDRLLTEKGIKTHKAYVGNYFTSLEMMGATLTVMKLDDMEDHIWDISLTSGSSVGDANKIDETTMIFAQQKALGDMANGYGIAIMNSLIFARYQALGLVDYNKYTVTNAVTQEVNLPTINGLIPVVSDRYTVDTTGDAPKYITTIVGQGAILTARKTNYEEPYYTDYDPETTAGVEKLYTKEGRVLHPNGFNLKVANIANESPAKTELGTDANWELAYDAKNVRIGQIISNG